MRKHQIKGVLFLLLFLTLLLPQYVCAQTENFTIKGQIMDSTLNESVPYATIKITSTTNKATVLKALAADDNGKFVFTIGKGSYHMGIQYVGKEVYNEILTVGQEKTLDLGKININTSDTQLGEVTVTAQKPLVKVDLDKIIYSLEEDPESKTNNVLDMLRKVPLITVNGDEEIELKGSSNYKIYMDGKPSAMIASNPKDVLKSMPASSIKDIEVITDPGAKYDAEGVAGIINIITNKNSSLGGYTATVNAGASTAKDIYGGVYFTMKYGKIGFTGNFNHYRYNPTGLPSGSERETFARIDANGVEHPSRFLISSGRSKNKGNGLYGSGQISYEIDTLNLLQLSFNKYGGSGKFSSDAQYLQNEEGNPVATLDYDRFNHGEYKYGTNTINADYQRTFSGVKDRLLTLSYRVDISPNANTSDYFSEIVDRKEIDNEITQQNMDGSSTDHTVQVDFTTPIAKIHTIEAGMKFINRNNKSDNSRYDWDYDNDIWEVITSPMDNFKNTQDILSAYAGYSVKVKKWGVKTGVRYEGTWMSSKFKIEPDYDYKTDYSNFVPSAAITYQLKPGQTFRTGYNMSINRPGLWHLNPYLNTSDPLNHRQGNSRLDAVKYHTMNLNYNFFNPKFNMNVNMSYNFTNNNIEEVSTIKDDVTLTTYDNIGKSRTLYLSFYGNWSPTQKFRLYGNLGMNYYDMRQNRPAHGVNNVLKVDGVRPQFSAGIQYTLPWKLITNTNGGYYGAWRGLERKGVDFYYYSFSLSRSFIKDKLTVRLNAQNPFQTNRKMEFSQETLQYRNESWSTRRMRSFGINVSFRFGEMKERIKTTQRGISNTDQMSGGEGGGGGSQGGGGQQQN